MNFIHKMVGTKSFAYCRFSDISSINKVFYSRVYINHRLEVHGINPDYPVMVDFAEYKGVIKIFHTNDIYVIATESTYVFQKYPECKKKSQHLTEIDIDCKPTKVYIIVYEYPDGSEKEFIFDISDIKNKFINFENELKKSLKQDNL